MRRTFTPLRILRIVLVVLAPIAFYLGARERWGSSAGVAVWADLAGAGDGRYRPRSLVFDGARKQVPLAAARGEAVTFALRLRADRALAGVRAVLDPLGARPGGGVPLGARVFRASGGLLLPAAAVDVDVDVPAGELAEWLVELEVPASAAPGVYVGALHVASASGEIDRLTVITRVSAVVLRETPLPLVVRDAPAGWRPFLAAHRATAAPPFPAGTPFRQGAESPREAAWRAYAAGAAWLDAGEAGEYASAPAGAPAAKPRLWELRRAADDLRMLAILRARGDAMAGRIVARATATPSPSPERWEEERRELLGLLNAPGHVPVR